jgi:hypothetical protein
MSHTSTSTSRQTHLELLIALYCMCLVYNSPPSTTRDTPGACHSALLHVSHIQLLLLVLLETHLELVIALLALAAADELAHSRNQHVH